MSKIKTDNEYRQWLVDLKKRIRQSQIKAAVKVNAEYIGVVVIRQYASGNKKLYVHEVFLKRKLLDGSSNPAHIPATNQGVIPESPINKQNLVTNKGNIAKVLQKIISAKSD